MGHHTARLNARRFPWDRASTLPYTASSFGRRSHYCFPKRSENITTIKVSKPQPSTDQTSSASITPLATLERIFLQYASGGMTNVGCIMTRSCASMPSALALESDAASGSRWGTGTGSGARSGTGVDSTISEVGRGTARTVPQIAHSSCDPARDSGASRFSPHCEHCH